MNNGVINREKLDEKYRPRFFTDLAGNSEIIGNIREMAKSKSIPHLCLSGNAGNGKTSTAHVLVKDLLGSVNKRDILELNASDENGIDVIRTRVKEFASRSGTQTRVTFKIIILDEADELTAKAQSALRRIMEMYYKSCRFILICNYKWKIIDPILSRCVNFDFARITAEEMLPRLSYICEQEHINITQDALKRIAEKSNGDMRTALNSYLEKLRNMNSVTIGIETIDKLDIGNDALELILKNSLNGRFVKGRQYFLNAMKRGLNSRQIINAISDKAISNGYPDIMKGDVALACLESEKLILDGCSDELVIAGLIARLTIIGKKY